MVKYSYWDKFLGKRPKQFKRDVNKQLKDNTLIYMQKYGRHNWIPICELFEQTLEQTDLFNSKEGTMFFAMQGIKSKFNWATSALRTLGHPIISGSFYGKKKSEGYIYADENCDDFINIWKQKRSALEERKNNVEKEVNKDKELMKRILERLIAKNRLEEAQKLKQVLIQYQR